MSVVNAVALLAAAGGDYQISRSVRLRSSASAYFNRTIASTPTSWTASFWVKRGVLGGYQTIFGSRTSGLGSAYIQFNSNDTFGVANNATAVATVAVFRDPSAWYHFTVNWTSGNSVSIWCNGVLQSVTGSISGANQLFTSTWTNTLGRYGDSASQYFDGYITEVNFIDGQALTPSSFGETDAVTGVWKPKKYAGTYGTNGFYLNFSDPSAATAAAIGKDYSGNGNNWTPNNISVTAGATYDSMIDVPTLGGSGSNHCVLNPLSNNQRGSMALSNGNLQWTNTSTSVSGGCPGTMDVNPVGKVYFEGVPTAIGQSGDCAIGLSQVTGNWATIGSAANASLYDWAASGSYYNAGSTIAAGTFTANDVIMVAYDQSSGKVWFGKNGTWNGIGNPATGANPAFTISDTATGKLPFVMGYSSPVWIANFGQRPFTYTPPTGFKALNTQNLPDATIKKGGSFFNAVTYTGDSTNGRAVTTGFTPDFVWIKNRSAVWDHILGNSQILSGGEPILLSSNSTSAEFANGYIGNVSQWTSTTFTVNGDSRTNASGSNYAAWAWKESVSAGFDIVTYQANGTANRAIAHSLGVAPKFIIVKDRSGVVNWNCWFTGFTADEYLQLNTTAAKGSYSTLWYQTPTSSNFYIGSTGTGVNLTSGNNYVAYLFAEVAGFSKFGSYTGNGSTDGVFVYLGFKPAFVMLKRTDSTGNWNMYDDTRSPTNAAEKLLYANLSNAEDTWPTGTGIDILSNGFKLRRAESDHNASGGTFVYAAFAENPFKNSLAR